MTSADPAALVSTEWVAAHLSDPDLRILDCTWHHASTNLDGRTQYRGRHLPGSVHFDIDHVADTSSPLPHMLPNAADFAKKIGLLGVGYGDRVVVYDRLCGGAAAARAWWMFRVFGYDKVAMLDGGFGKWTKEKLPAEMSPVRPQPKSFTATFNPGLVRTLSDMTANLAIAAEQVIDARGPRSSTAPKKMSSLSRSSATFRMPSTFPGPISSTFTPDALAARFAAAGIDLQRPIVTTCASGITSCVVTLGLYLLGHSTAAVYDGSWAEWGLAEDTPAVAA